MNLRNETTLGSKSLEALSLTLESLPSDMSLMVIIWCSGVCLDSIAYPGQIVGEMLII